MSEVKVNKITPTADCGTVTLGDSGDTFTIPSGATLDVQGTSSGILDIQWDTTAKTASFTAVAGNGYFVNTTSGEITVTLPASPSAGDFVAVKDYANTADTNNIVIARNGSNIQGVANDFNISTEGLSITLIYVDATQGWVSTGASKASDISEEPLYIAATGGCITTCGNFKIHKFTGPGTFTVTCAGNPLGADKVDYLVVAGGGGGIGQYSGGGAGGHRFAFHIGSPSPSPFNAPACESARSVTAQAYPITVGAGGAGSPTPAPSLTGSPTTFSSITSAGGGGASPKDGGSGSGASGEPPNPGSNPKGSGNVPPVSPPQGHPGGPNSAPRRGGGGGGAGAAGGSAAGGNGIALPVAWFIGAGGGDNFPEGRYFSGGGGGGTENTPGSPYAGGKGGGGDGGNRTPGSAGDTNTGGGGGSGSRGTGGTGTYYGAAGGSGIVYIKYQFQGS